MVLPELPKERAQPHIYNHVYIYSVQLSIIQEGAGEMIQWPAALHTLAEDPSLFLGPTWQVTTIHNFVYRGFNTAPDLHRHQAFTWYIDRHAGKLSIHIKKNKLTLKKLKIWYKILHLLHYLKSQAINLSVGSREKVTVPFWSLRLWFSCALDFVHSYSLFRSCMKNNRTSILTLAQPYITATCQSDYHTTNPPCFLSQPQTK